MFRLALDRVRPPLALFGIFDDHNAMRAHNPTGNFRPFMRCFCPADAESPRADAEVHIPPPPGVMVARAALPAPDPSASSSDLAPGRDDVDMYQ